MGGTLLSKGVYLVSPFGACFYPRAFEGRDHCCYKFNWPIWRCRVSHILQLRCFLPCFQLFEDQRYPACCVISRHHILRLRPSVADYHRRFSWLFLSPFPSYCNPNMTLRKPMFSLTPEQNQNPSPSVRSRKTPPPLQIHPLTDLQLNTFLVLIFYSHWICRYSYLWLLYESYIWLGYL